MFNLGRKSRRPLNGGYRRYGRLIYRLVRSVARGVATATIRRFMVDQT